MLWAAAARHARRRHRVQGTAAWEAGLTSAAVAIFGDLEGSLCGVSLEPHCGGSERREARITTTDRRAHAGLVHAQKGPFGGSAEHLPAKPVSQRSSAALLAAQPEAWRRS